MIEGQWATWRKRGVRGDVFDRSNGLDSPERVVRRESKISAIVVMR